METYGKYIKELNIPLQDTFPVLYIPGMYIRTVARVYSDSTYFHTHLENADVTDLANSPIRGLPTPVGTWYSTVYTG